MELQANASMAEFNFKSADVLFLPHTSRRALFLVTRPLRRSSPRHTEPLAVRHEMRRLFDVHSVEPAVLQREAGPPMRRVAVSLLLVLMFAALLPAATARRFQRRLSRAAMKG